VDDSDPGRLFAALEEQAREERGRIEAEAAEQASRIIADGDREVERLRAQARQDLRRELVVEGRRLLGEARARARIERLRAKRALLAEVFEGAGEAIERMKAGRGYREALDALAAEARASIGEPCSVEVRAEDASVIATSADGRRRADNSLATRIVAARGSAEPEVGRILFGARRPTGRAAAGGEGSP
jgi:vacuolar-type H+-ATPase subunit E/Vma4